MTTPRFDARDYGLPEHVPCTFCGGEDTELHSPFGSALSVSTYWCRRCYTAFEWVKWKERDPGVSPGDPAP